MVTQALTIAVINWLLAARRPQAAPSSGGRFGLGYSRRYRVVILILFLAATGFLVMGLLAFRDDPQAFLIGSGIFGLMWLGAAYCAWDTFCVRLSFSEMQLVREPSLGTITTLSWGEIAGLGFSANSNLFTFSTPTGRRFRVSLFRDGLGTLAEVAGRRLDSSPAAGSLPVLYEKARNPKGRLSALR